MSVITATSAAALAIAATSPNSSIYWLVTAFYSIAFGLSLQGLILITYITIAAGGSSDEAIERLAKGELFSDWPIPVPFSQIISVRAAALVMALPAILATYSSISLLMGLVAMVCSGASGRGKGVETHQRQYALVTMIPVGVAFFFLCVAILLSEATVWIEIRGRENYRLKQKDLEEAGHGAETAEQSPTSPTVSYPCSRPKIVTVMTLTLGLPEHINPVSQARFGWTPGDEAEWRYSVKICV